VSFAEIPPWLPLSPATAVPDEFLFLGLIQNTLERTFGRAALPIASIIFGLAHLPDLR
jgi:membrane protease YdiL (CAAX protease family)